MTETSTNQDEQKEIQQLLFKALAENDTLRAKQLLVKLNNVNCLDDDGMTPLQHACCRGNKELVRVLLDMGADVYLHTNGDGYSPLHFAAISGKVDLCRMLLDAGADPNLTNSVSRTAAQMAAFVGNHACADVINNYLLRKILEPYTVSSNKEPLIPAEKLDAVHKFVTEVNLHPVRIALNLQTFGLLRQLKGLRKLLIELCNYYMSAEQNTNDVKALKYHYFGWVVAELLKCEKRVLSQRESLGSEVIKSDFVELFVKRVLKESKQPQQDYTECMIRECVREFPYWESAVIRLITTQLTIEDAPPALSVLRNVINGIRGFVNESSVCSTCSNENPDKRCSKCKVVQYCDRECQRLHWFIHKKACARLGTTTNTLNQKSADIDVSELQEEISKLKSES